MNPRLTITKRSRAMKKHRVLLPFLLVCCGTLQAGTRTSANYSITTETTDSGGVYSTSANYSNAGSMGGVVGISSVASTVETARNGYIGQLYDVVGLVVTSSSTSVNEGGTLQLGAAQVLDDATQLPIAPSLAAWSAHGGPIAGIDANGLATAATVYQDSPAIVGAVYQGFGGTLLLLVINVSNDDFGAYANDGIDDAWQVHYFGMNNPQAAPNVDADGTGQTNLFKYIAGLNPIDPTSRFVVSIQPVPGQPGQEQVIFNPTVAGRTYTVVSKASLADPNWVALGSTTQSDNGTQRTVTDLNATGSNKFYKVQISKP